MRLFIFIDFAVFSLFFQFFLLFGPFFIENTTNEERYRNAKWPKRGEWSDPKSDNSACDQVKMSGTEYKSENIEGHSRKNECNNQKND